MSHTSVTKRSIFLVFSTLIILLCCDVSPVWAQAATNQVPITGRPTVTGSDSIQIPVDNFGRTLNTGVCIFEENAKLYEEWGKTVDSAVEGDVGPINTTGPRAGLPTRTAVRENMDVFGKSTEWGCPVFHLQDGSHEWTEPLSECQGFYRMMAGLAKTDEASTQNPDVVKTQDLDPNIACCHVRYQDRANCAAMLLASQKKLQANMVSAGVNMGVATQGFSPEQQKQIEEKKQEKRSAARQCFDEKLKNVQTYFKGRQIATCIQAVKDYFSKKAKALRQEARDNAGTKVTENSSDTGHITAGTSAGPGNLPARTVGSIVLGVKGAAKIAVIAAQISEALELGLGKCAKIAGNYGSLEDLMNKVLNVDICEATLGLIERQLTQCIRVDFSGDLSLPQFNVVTQCPINFSLSMRVSPSGITCTRTITGQSAVTGGVNGSGMTFLNGAGLAEDIAGGDPNCFRKAAVTDKDGNVISVGPDGTVDNGGNRAATPTIPGVDCRGNLDQDMVNFGKAINGIMYLPPGPEIANNGSGWVVGPVHDTGFPSFVPAFGGTVSRCDYYVKGRITRTAYVFGDGSQCNSSATGFLNSGKETLSTCYPKGGYKPVEKSAIPEACFYRQGNPQPCLKEDLSGLAPRKVTTLGSPSPIVVTVSNRAASGGSSAGGMVASIPVTVTNTGLLMSVVNSRSQNTVLANGQVLAMGSLLTTTPVANFVAPATIASTTSVSLRSTGLTALTPYNGVTLGDVVELAVDQTACARAFATHDSIGGALVPRLYPLPKPVLITNADGTVTQQFTGQCSDFSAVVNDKSCCDPQSQDCTKPPLSALPICACDQGDATARAIVALNPDGSTIFELDANNQPTTKPKYICVDKDNELIPAANKTCCNAKANGEGAVGCGSPLGVNTADPNNPLADPAAQSLMGAVQYRALGVKPDGSAYQPPETSPQAAGFQFTNDNRLERCADEAGMCVKQDSQQGIKMKEIKPNPYNYLLVRPDSSIKALNGQVKQCCLSKWCNICPHAYAGALGLTVRQSLAEMQSYVATGVGHDAETGAADPWGGMPRPAAESDWTVDMQTLQAVDPNKANAEFKWNMQLFREGWPRTTVINDNGVREIYTGRGAWVGLMSQWVDGDVRRDIHRNRIWAVFPINDGDNDINKDYFGNAYDMGGYQSGRPALFPNFTISGGLPKEMLQKCAEEVESNKLSNSWELFKDDVRTSTPNNVKVWGIVGKQLWNFIGNQNAFTTSSAAAGQNNWAPPFLPTRPNQSLKDLFTHYWGKIWIGPSPAAWSYDNPVTGQFGYPGFGFLGNRSLLTWLGNTGSSDVAGMKMSDDTWSGIDAPSVYPIEYLNQLKAKFTPPGQDFEEIKLCSEALPLCTDPKLNQYSDSMGNGGNGPGGLGTDTGNPWGNGNGNGNGDGANGNGSGAGTGNIPPQCVGISDPVALAACIAQYGANGGNVGSINCNDPTLILSTAQAAACAGQNGGGNGNVPPQCVGLTAADLAACMQQYAGAGANGGTGLGGTRQGGIRGNGAGFSGTGSAGGGSGSGAGAGSGGGAAGGSGASSGFTTTTSSRGTSSTTSGPRPITGSGTGIGFTPRTNTGSSAPAGGAATSGSGAAGSSGAASGAGSGSAGSTTTGTSGSTSGTSGGSVTILGPSGSGALF